MNKKQLAVALILKRLLFIVGASFLALNFCFAKDLLTNEEIERMSDNLDRVVNELQEPLDNKKKAALLFEKSTLMFNIGGGIAWLDTPTNDLLEAIKLAPDTMNYIEYLHQVYSFYWKERDFSGDDEISVRLTNTKKEVEKVLGIAVLSSE